MKGTSFAKRFAWEIWLPIVLLVVWYFVSERFNSFYCPPLSEILSASAQIWIWQGTIDDVVPSVVRLVSGFIIGTIAGIVVGVALGLWRAAEDAVRPVLEFLRAVPGVALLPLVILFLGVGDSMKIVMIAIVSFWPVLLNTIDAVRSVEPVQLQVSRSFHIGGFDRLAFILLPSSAPQVFAGARTALATSVIAMVFTEMVGSPGGIGYFILNAQRRFDTVDMWSGILVLGIVGYLLNNLFRLVEMKVLRWHHQMTSRAQTGA
jgi:ABC-type nitrate/sulfonate/bicarbonate transport system permease component